MDKLNEFDLKNVFGVVILTGTEKLLEYPERKAPLQTEYNDQNGTSYNLNDIYFKDKETTLSCAIMANNDIEFWSFYDSFFSEIAKVGIQHLYISDHSKTYFVFYKKTSGFKKSLKRLKNVPKVFVKFDLTLQVL